MRTGIIDRRRRITLPESTTEPVAGCRIRCAVVLPSLPRTLSMAEPAVAADGAGKSAFHELRSLQPAPLLNLIVRRRGDGFLFEAWKSRRNVFDSRSGVRYAGGVAPSVAVRYSPAG